MNGTAGSWTQRPWEGLFAVDHNNVERSLRTLRSSPTASPEQRAINVRSLLQQLGPHYSSFALYLSSRPDLLPAEYCREFALTSDSSSPLAERTVEQILRTRLGADLDLYFLEFNPTPLRSTLICQSHLATLRTGAPVTVLLLRPEYYSLQTGRGALESFDVALLRRYCSEIVADKTVDDFINTLRRKTNFATQAEALDQMAEDAASLEFLGSNKVYSELCTKCVMVIERREDSSLNQFLGALPDSADLLGLRMCEVWLHQAFFGRCYPVDPRECNVLIRSNRQICFNECDLAALPKTAKENLWNYLMAAAMDEPDIAALHLLAEMYPSPHARVDPEAFRGSFRQAASFGELEPILGTNSNSLPQLVFQHWKTAVKHGYSPHPHLLSLYRGLFSIARIGQAICPARDLLREGLEELRTAKTLRQFVDLAEWGSMLHEGDKFATAFAEIPKALNDLLSKAAHLSQESLLLSPRSQAEPESGSTLGGLAVLFLLAATVFVSQPSLQAGRWSPPLAALTLMLAGLLVLKRIMS